MRLQHDLNESIALIDPARELTLWKYTYAGKPKPFFHPLCTPAGHCISIFEPHDHPWHRGLWFTIKLINGENFWEENVEHGVQKTLSPPKGPDCFRSYKPLVGRSGRCSCAPSPRWH